MTPDFQKDHMPKDKKMITKNYKTVNLSIVRTAIANYMKSEGCSCCCNTENHRENKAQLAKLLNVPMYKDESGLESIGAVAVSINEKDDIETGYVFYNEESCSFRVKLKNNQYAIFGGKNIKIIGDIFENPELLIIGINSSAEL